MPFRAVTEQWRSKWRRQPAEKPSSSLPDTPQTTVQPREIAHYQKPNEPREQRESLPPKEHRETHEPRESKEHKTHTITPPNEVPTPEKKAHEKKISTKEYPPSADTLLGGIGDYIFLDPLGRGKFSTVIMAQHYLTGDKFAVKIIDKRAHDYRVMSRLVREITLMEVIDHPNIVHLYETYETADSLYLVMEYVPGLNLDEYLQRQHGALEEREARAIFRQMVAAVDYCHSRWVVHRDLKAPNILLTPQGDVRLADFGLGNRFGLQRLKTICGSMLYYSPEIISGQKYMGPEVDCWCLGVSLFRMTAGFEPFAHAHTVGELRKDVVHGNYPMPEHLSQGLQRTIRKCLAVDRRKRIALRVALKGDAWLNDNGRLPDLFAEKSVSIEACDGDEAVRLRLEKDRNKRQYMKDMEDERQTGVRAKRTVIYHPLSECIYYTSPTPHSPKPEENHRTQELLRAELFQEIKATVQQLHLQSIPNLSLSDVKSPLHHLFRKFRRSEQPLSDTFPQTRLRKTTSTLSLSQLYHRVTKDQITYYTMQRACPLSCASPAPCDHSSTSFSSYSNTNSPSSSLQPPSSSGDRVSKEEHELLLLVKSACEILGITYQHDGRSRLGCVLTLRNFSVEKNRGAWLYSMLRDGPMNPSISTPTLFHAYSQEGYSSDPWTHGQSNSSLVDKSKGRWSRQLKRLSIPLHQLPWSNSIQLSSSAAIHHSHHGSHGSQALANQQGPSRTEPMPIPSVPAPVVYPEDPPPNKEGTALFSIEVFSVPANENKHQRAAGTRDEAGTQHRMVALRFSKASGSTKVFKLASGWIGGVLTSSEHYQEART